MHRCACTAAISGQPLSQCRNSRSQEILKVPFLYSSLYCMERYLQKYVLHILDAVLTPAMYRTTDGL